MARALALESFLGGDFDVAGVARMLLEDLSSPASVALGEPSQKAPPEPVIDPDSADHRAGEIVGREAATAALADDIAAAVARAEAAEERVAALEPQLTGALAAIEQARRGAERRMAEDAAAIIGAALEALLPEFARKGFAAEAAASVREWLSRAASAEGVLYVPAGFEAELSAAVEASAGAAANISVRADDALEPGAARFEWRDGLGELDLNESADRIRAAFDAHAERLGLAAAMAAKALQPPVEKSPMPIRGDVDAAAAADASEAAAVVDAEVAEKAPGTSRRAATGQKNKSVAPGGEGALDAEPVKAPARARKSKAASARADAPADAASESKVKKAPSRRRKSGVASSAKASSGDNDE